MNPTKVHNNWLFGNVNASFWKRAFLVYGLSEIGYWIVYYITIYLQDCGDCLFPVGHHLTLCILNVLSTWLVWQVLYRFSTRKKLLNIIFNVFVFAGHQVIWFLTMYALFNIEADLWNRQVGYSHGSFENAVGVQIASIWFDTGKYLIKVTIFYCLKSYIDFKNTEKQKGELLVLNKDLQLNLLKQQLNPHFYFNTMNNLYGLSRRASPLLFPAVNQLSGIMHYVLKDCNEEKVGLEKEIDFLRNYVALEKLRYESDTVIEFAVHGDPAGKKIVSLLLIQFVENAFKHGMKEKTAQNWMKVELSIRENMLRFNLANSCYSEYSQEGIGLGSSRKRLELMYKGHYQLASGIKDNIFTLDLLIELI